MATREEIYEAIRNADKAGDAESVQKLGAYLKTMPVASPEPAKPSEDGFASSAARALFRLTPAGLAASAMTQEGRQDLGNAAAGALRGAGSIGATLLYPFDKAADIIKGDRGPSITGLVTGQQPVSRNDERRSDMDVGLRMMGSNPESGLYKVAKIGTEIAGTSGTGGVLANLLGRSGAIAANAPNAIQAIRTAGMSAGSATGIANPLLRAAGGAVNGGASAALIDPDAAATGAAVGGLLPGAMGLAGKAGNAIGQAIRGPDQSAELAAAIKAARDAGYVIPPSQANPSFLNRTLEGFSGKITTAQNASAKNQAVTNAKAATAIGLPAETTLTPEVLDGVRAEASKAYKAVSELGAFDATGAKLPASVAVTRTPANAVMGRPETASVDAGEVVRAWRQANADATAYYRQYGRDANPETLTKAKAAAAEAKTLDEFMVKSTQVTQKNAPQKLIADLASGAIDQQAFLQKALALTQQGDLANELKAARVLIAKTHSVEDAMNAATGTIDARKLAKQLQKGKPLSGDLKDAAEFAGRFPKASQPVEAMGSLPQTSPLDWALGGSLSAASANPLMMATVMARPAARSLVLSPAIQNRLVQSTSPNQLSALANPAVNQIPYRVAPALAAGR